MRRRETTSVLSETRIGVLGSSLIVGTAIALSALPASATDVCTVLKSADGFVALRDAPSAKGAEIARAKPGEALVIQKTESGDLIEKGRWIKVFHFPGAVIPQESDPEYNKGSVGWMHRSFVADCG